MLVESRPSRILVLAFFIALAGCAAPSTNQVIVSGCAVGSRGDDGCSIVNGSHSNSIADRVSGATIGGGGQAGLPNQVTGDFGAIGGGLGNRSSEQSTIGGGAQNLTQGYRNTIGGGSGNQALSSHATVGGGADNAATFVQATVGGGSNNTASARNATVAGGSANTANFTHATVGGGSSNTSSGLNATVAGGARNVASGTYSAVAGGSGNTSAGFDATVAGGSGNQASGRDATIGGGLANQATGQYSVIAGGRGNMAGTAQVDETQYAAVGGGSSNTASGSFSTVPGGASNSATGAYSLAAGRRARVQAQHNGTILFADSSDADFVSATANEFAVRATGGVRLVTAIDSAGAPLAGVRLAAGGGSWSTLSDRDAKSNMAPVDGRKVLAQLLTVPIATWRFKTEAGAVRHMGPTAQDFAVFGMGDDPRYISSVDADGVALAAIQGLYQVQQEKDAEIAMLKAENDALRSQIARLDTRLTALEGKMGMPAASAELPMRGLSDTPLLLGALGFGLAFLFAKRGLLVR